jgi:hypothetical protein
MSSTEKGILIAIKEFRLLKLIATKAKLMTKKAVAGWS